MTEEERKAYFDARMKLYDVCSGLEKVVGHVAMSIFVRDYVQKHTIHIKKGSDGGRPAEKDDEANTTRRIKYEEGNRISVANELKVVANHAHLLMPFVPQGAGKELLRRGLHSHPADKAYYTRGIIPPTPRIYRALDPGARKVHAEVERCKTKP